MKCVKHLLGALLALCILVLPNIARAQWSQSDYKITDGFVLIDDKWSFDYPMYSYGAAPDGSAYGSFDDIIPHVEANAYVGKAYSRANYVRSFTWSPAGTTTNSLTLYLAADGATNSADKNSVAYAHSDMGAINLTGGVYSKKYSKTIILVSGTHGPPSPISASFLLWCEGNGVYSSAYADASESL